MIRDINKFSNNTMARQLFLTMGAAESTIYTARVDQHAGGRLATDSRDSRDDLSRVQAFSEVSLPAEQEGGDITGEERLISLPETAASVPLPANIAHSTAALRHWLKTQQLHFPELVLENGAGLSRKERISALHLAELLQHATNSPFHAEMEASLPILGMDGTVKKRFTGSEIAGYAHLKTGSLKGVKSVAGYVQAQSGKRWIVVFLVNHPNAAFAQPAQDALIEWLQTLH